MPRSYRDIKTIHGNASARGMSVIDQMNRGAVPPELLGVKGNKHGGSQFSSVAHTTEQMQKLNNLVNNSVDDQLVFKVMGLDENGVEVPKTLPFEFGGQIVRPDASGTVRITDKGKVDMATKIAIFRKKRTNEIMEIVRLGDDIAQYIFGIKEDDWEAMCSEDPAENFNYSRRDQNGR
jgi:hypothetical protein